MLLRPAAGRHRRSCSVRSSLPACSPYVCMLYAVSEGATVTVSGHRCMSDLHMNVVASCYIHQSDALVAQAEFVEEYEL